MSTLPISPLSLDCLTRDYAGSFDAAILAQLAPLCEEGCYLPKLYRAPAVANSLFAAKQFVSYGLKITPGAIIWGIYLPPSSPTSNLPGAFNVQIRDQSLKHDWFSQPIPSYFLANNKPSYLAVGQNVIGSGPAFLDGPYPVVGNGLFLVEIWETSNAVQRIELVFGVLEPQGRACL